jgi:hypothetical protein
MSIPSPRRACSELDDDIPREGHRPQEGTTAKRPTAEPKRAPPRGNLRHGHPGPDAAKYLVLVSASPHPACARSAPDSNNRLNRFSNQKVAGVMPIVRPRFTELEVATESEAKTLTFQARSTS